MSEKCTSTDPWERPDWRGETKIKFGFLLKDILNQKIGNFGS